MNKLAQLNRLMQGIGARLLGLIVGIVMVSYGVTAMGAGHLHDFISYYYGTVAIAKGLNGYSAQVLSELMGAPLQGHLRFVYPPQMSWVFVPLTWVSFDTARLVFVGAKVAIGLAFLALAATVFRPEKGNRFFFGLIALFGFHSAVSIDIATGNIALLEAILIWGGIALLLKNRPGWAGILIGLGASFKLTPILILLGLTGTQHPLKWRAISAGILTFLGIQSVGIIVYPDLYRYFFDLKNPLDSSGFVNPSSLALIRFELAPLLSQWLGVSPLWIERGLYGGVVSIGLSLIAWIAFNRVRFSVIEWMSAVLLIYAIVMPRFKDYTFVLLLIPAWVVVSSIQNRWWRWGVVAMVCVSLWPYHHLMMAGILLGFLVAQRGPGSVSIRLSKRQVPKLRRTKA